MALLDVKNIVKNYGDVEALKGISLSVEKGEVAHQAVEKVHSYAH